MENGWMFGEINPPNLDFAGLGVYVNNIIEKTSPKMFNV